VLLQRQYFGGAAVPHTRGPAIAFEPQWKQLLSAGTSRGDTLAPVQLIEFADFECPFCQKFTTVAAAIEAKYPGKIHRVFVHMPIPLHRFAYHTARMTECAGAQGQWWAMHDLLFAKQDSFGIKPWSGFVAEARIRDVESFARCSSSADKVDVIERGIAARERFQVTSTPTVIVNGWRYAVPPTEALLTEAVDRVLAGKVPTVAGKVPTESR
jgi:protein-disulfide isomerase